MTRTLVFLLIASMAWGQKRVIFDTDIAPDYDDVGAMALLHAFADRGEVTILATISCNAFETTAPTLSVLNTYFKRPDIPIGITKGDLPRMACSQQWAEYINGKYPHALTSNEQAEDAVRLYRRLLAAQPDKSVTIITVGFFTNVANLLRSRPDPISPLDGKQLVEKKVVQLVSMAAGTGEGDKGFREYNVHVDAPASQLVFAEWPTPMIISGWDIGHKILTGIRLINSDRIKESPVKDAFDLALKKDKNTQGRNSWDQTAVLVAVRGLEPWFSFRKVDFEIKDDGTSIPREGERFTYLTFSKPPEEIAVVIEDLMMHQPEER